MVLDDELAGSILRARRGFPAGPEALAVEVVAAVMDSSRNFLGQKHTLKTLRSGELWLTRLAERASWDSWEQGGRRGMAERAQQEAERILREHQVPPLEAVQEKELDALLQAARTEFERG
jgi:trimethylamine--corrinoid protein Co-methyltransferase